MRRWGLAAGAGAALGLSMPGPAIVPLLLLVPGLLRRSLAEESGWRALRTGWLAGTVQWLVAVPWITTVLGRYGHTGWLIAIVGWVLLALILGLTWALAAWSATRLPEHWRMWGVPLALAAAEVAQASPPWGFPWNPIAAVVTPFPVLLTPLPVVGAAGLSLLLLLAGGALDALVERRQRVAGAAQLALVLVAFVAAAVAAPPFRPGGPAIEVAALQPNVPLEERWDQDNEGEIEARVWRLSGEAAHAGARWIVWPESAVPRVLEQDARYRNEVERFARTHGVWMLVGSIGFGPGEGEYANSVYAVSPAGLTPWRYDKLHLVPFGEYVPLVGKLAFLRPLVHEVGAFTPGTKELPLPSPLGPVGVAVCYEVAFPSLYAAEVRAGARVLATITNDGWYGDSAAPRQHLALAILRAVENRRYLVRAANTGISAVIDPSGRVVSRLGVGREGLITAEVRPGLGETPAVVAAGAVRVGIVACLLGAILMSAWRGRERTTGRRATAPARRPHA